MENNKDKLLTEYQLLAKKVLPRLADSLGFPIKEDHCFYRVVLDWLVQDKWDRVLDKPAYKQLTEEQLEKCIDRMYIWIECPSILRRDNKNSLSYRKRIVGPTSFNINPHAGFILTRNLFE